MRQKYTGVYLERRRESGWQLYQAVGIPCRKRCSRPSRPRCPTSTSCPWNTAEHRYYPPSRPDPVDWTKDALRQGAADQHRIIVALRAIHDQKWITTDGCKGGYGNAIAMASIPARPSRDCAGERHPAG